jgi:hypothetical protein
LKIIFKAIATFALLTFGLNLNAQLIIAGAGTITCGEYVKYRRENSELSGVITTWAQGYLSGVNVQSGGMENKKIDIPEYETLGLMLENACIQNPTFKIWMVTEGITRDFLQKLRRK